MFYPHGDKRSLYSSPLLFLYYHRQRKIAHHGTEPYQLQNTVCVCGGILICKQLVSPFFLSSFFIGIALWFFFMDSFILNNYWTFFVHFLCITNWPVLLPYYSKVECVILLALKCTPHSYALCNMHQLSEDLPLCDWTQARQHCSSPLWHWILCMQLRRFCGTLVIPKLKLLCLGGRSHGGIR